MASFEKLKQRWSKERSKQETWSVAFKKKLQEKGTPIFKKYNLKTVFLFGSVAAGRSRQDSDVDLYVSFLPADEYWTFRHELEEAVQLSIDLYTDRDDSRFVRKIIERGEKVYGV